MFDQAKADEICERIAQKPASLSAILRENPNLPPERTVYGWLKSNPEFQQNYARAREDQADVDADLIADIRAQMLAGELTPEQARVAIDSLKWSAGKRKPKVYGDRSALELTGKDGADLYAGLGRDELRAEILRRMSDPQIAAALGVSLPAQALAHDKPKE